nr:putative ABC transporter permease [uncultured Sellimonas sp.]
MWYNQMILGQSSYEVILWFLIYSVMGWLVESIYMSFCNRKVTNRGFTKGPCCPIYGCGALAVYFTLLPFQSNPVALFILGSILATTLELLTAVIMKRVFGTVWWDYSEKPFNFHGILCLESSIAWGVYTVFLFTFLHGFVQRIVQIIPPWAGRIFGSLFMILYMADFLNTIWKIRQRSSENEEETCMIGEERMDDEYNISCRR